MRKPSALLLLLGACAGQNGPSVSSRPNIVLILADDLGFSDLGCYGSEIRTPNLDRLAARGTRFKRFYTAARCCPTRASLLTGVYPHQAGVGHMVEDRGHAAYRGHLNARPTIAEVLRGAGYRTAMAGKWHVGDAPNRRPRDRGFERYFGLLGGGSNYFELEKGRVMLKDDVPWTPPAGEPFYMTDAFSDAAVGFVRESTSRFFLYLAYTAPHWPLQAPAEDVDKYTHVYDAGWHEIRAARLRRQAGLVPGERDPSLPPWTGSPLESAKMAVYAAMVERMDRQIGRVLDVLPPNTLVVFLSDNGASPEEYPRVTPKIPPGPRESFHTCGPSWAAVSNAPLRGAKRSSYEGGISTAFIVAGPGVRAGRWTDEAGHVMDLMPTFAELAGAAAPEVEGRSLLPAFRGERLPERTLFWEHEGNRAALRGRWKLAGGHNGPWGLYDLERDRTEAQDLAAREPERARELAAAWEAWATRVGVRPFEELVPPRK